MRPEDLLDKVHDRGSFIAFVESLAEDRRQAQAIERENPNTYVYDGALGWANCDIPEFLDASLSFFADDPRNDPPDASSPSWKTLAEMLYCGKIIE